MPGRSGSDRPPSHGLPRRPSVLLLHARRRRAVGRRSRRVRRPASCPVLAAPARSISRPQGARPSPAAPRRSGCNPQLTALRSRLVPTQPSGSGAFAAFARTTLPSRQDTGWPLDLSVFFLRRVPFPEPGGQGVRRPSPRSLRALRALHGCTRLRSRFEADRSRVSVCCG